MGLRYADTRTAGVTDRTFTEAVICGLAESGGLFAPTDLPRLTLDEITGLASLAYHERAALLYERFGVDLPSETIASLMADAYGVQFDDTRVAPVAALDGSAFVLELWHGPTSAFKDMALQCMPRFFSAAIEKQRDTGALRNDVLILVATSGDTGKAALDGFANREHTQIAVLYPADGVSEIQRKQMVTQAGDNVNVFGVRGNFDDCQTAAKEVFGDEAFAASLAERGLVLSSANSINIGRLLPQVVYYVSAYADMVAAGSIGPGEPIDVCVPTGNFGNILAAEYARQMGVPIVQLICASNENDVLADFIETGTYDITGRHFVRTPSPSMDILVSSNLERLLYALAGPEKVARWMDDLRATGSYTVDTPTHEKLREHFVGGSVSNDESLATIREVWDTHGYLLDPHTAVAYRLAAEKARRTVLIVATAHWAKFAPDVLRGLTGTRAGEPMAEPYASHSEFDMLRDIAVLAPGCAPAPVQLTALEGVADRFTATIEPGRVSTEAAIEQWLDERA